MNDLLEILSEAFEYGDFLFTDQEFQTVLKKQAGSYVAVPKVKKQELSKRIYADSTNCSAATTFTVMVRCFGPVTVPTFSEGDELLSDIGEAVGCLQDSLGHCLISLEIGELTRNATVNRLTCDVTLKVRGYEYYGS
ncbi:MAG: hypothetical protein IKP47_08330 [Ruminococcus sp.]|nr:hypothetical protein [Ruminococcus sp.]